MENYPDIRPSYTIDADEFNWFYFLTDGFYTNWKVLCLQFRTLSHKKRKIQTAARISLQIN